jgi:hypothetical protein
MDAQGEPLIFDDNTINACQRFPQSLFQLF